MLNTRTGYDSHDSHDRYKRRENTKMARFVLTALGGSSIEWYDFFLYSTAAVLIFPVLFFPSGIPAYVALIASFSTFAFGFIARPIGAIVFSNLGVRAGRKTALVVVLILMGIATTIIGLLPTYAEIGVLAPIALVLCRFAQGLAIGGHWGAVVLLLTESAPPEKRGFYGAFAQAGAPIGLIVASLAFLLISHSLTHDQFIEWGWRCPFVVNFVLISLAIYAKFRLDETPSFHALEVSDPLGQRFRSGPAPVLKALAKFPREIVLAAGAVLAVQVVSITFLTFGFAYATDISGPSIRRLHMLAVVIFSSAFHIPWLFFFAAYSDRRGRFKISQLGAVLLGLLVFAVFPALKSGSLLVITVVFCMGQTFIAMMYGPYAAMLSELFSAEVRYSAASIAYQLGAMLGGGLAPVIATLILTTTGGTIWISVYAALACLVSWFCFQRLRGIQAQAPSLIAGGCYDGPGVK